MSHGPQGRHPNGPRSERDVRATSRSIVLTGGTGLIGRHLLRALGSDTMIYALCRSDLHDSVTVRPVVTDLAHAIDRARLPASVDAVVHLAQSTRFREFPAGADDMLAVNVARTIDLAGYAVAAGANTFVYASTGGVYGTGNAPFCETELPHDGRSLGFYPKTKLVAEQLLQPFASLMTVIVLRFFFVYGAGQKREMLVPRLVDSVRTGRAITLQGHDGITVNPVHASDAAAAVIAALALTQSATINVAGPEALSLRIMAEIIGQATAIPPLFIVQSEVKSGNLIGDIAVQTSLLGDPDTRFEAGIRDVL